MALSRGRPPWYAPVARATPRRRRAAFRHCRASQVVAYLGPLRLGLAAVPVASLCLVAPGCRTCVHREAAPLVAACCGSLLRRWLCWLGV